MRRKIIYSITLLFLALISSPAVNSYTTTIDDWQKLISEGGKYKFDGKYEAANNLFSKALDLAEQEKLPPKCLPISLCRLTEIEVITNKIPAADNHYSKLIEIIKQQKAAGTLDSQVNFWAAVLSDSYIACAKSSLKEPCLKHACYLKAILYNAEHRECLDCLNKLAACYAENGKVDKAIHILTLIQSVMEKKYGKNPDWLGNVINQLAIKARSDHKYEEAKRLEAVVIKQANENQGKLSNGLPAFYLLLSMIALAQNESAESNKYFHQALTACSKIKSSQRKLTEEYLDPLANLIKKDRKDKIKPYLPGIELEQLLAIHKAIPTDLNSQYLIYTYLAELDAGEFHKRSHPPNYLEDAIKIAELRKSSLGKYLPDLYMRAAIDAASTKNLDTMNKLFTKAEAADEGKTGFHPTLILLWWGYYLQSNKQFPLALQKLRAAFNQASKLSLKERGTLLADSTELISNITLYQLDNTRLAESLHQKSSEEIQLQKQLQSKLGPDLFHRL